MRRRNTAKTLVGSRPIRDFFKVPNLPEKKHWKPHEIEAFDAHGWHCHYCGALEVLTPDHMLATAEGGPDVAANIVPACRTCNSSKTNTIYDDFVEFIQAEIVAFELMHIGDHDR